MKKPQTYEYENTYIYNVIKPDHDVIHPVGKTVQFRSKTGQGEYKVISHVGCQKCGCVNEERLWTEPTLRAKKKETWVNHYAWCWNCGNYKALSEPINL